MSAVKQKKLTTGRGATPLYTHLVKNGIHVPLGTRLHLWVKKASVRPAGLVRLGYQTLVLVTGLFWVARVR